MVLSTEHRGRALLALYAKDIRHAEVTVQAHTHACIEAGRRIADWAFADNAVDSDPVKAIRSWVKGRHRPLVVTISGPNGRGKTVAAAKWVGRMGGMFLRSDAFGREDWTGGRLARRAVAVPHLVIDDLGSEHGRAREHVNSLISERFDAGRLTLVTTTLPFGTTHDQVGAVMGEYPGSVHSRMSAGFKAVGGDDLRGDLDPDLSGLERARRLSRSAETCRRLHALPEEERSKAIERLATELRVTPDSEDVVDQARKLAAQHDAASETLDHFAAEMVRRAVEVADKRGRR